MRRIHLNLISRSVQATKKMGKELGQVLPPGSILALEGDLGSGKTVFVQGLAAGLKVRDLKAVRSPTFSLIQEHRGAINLCHVDLYRISALEAMNLGLEEYWKDGAEVRKGKWVLAIEWAEKARNFVPSGNHPQSALEIHFEHVETKQRKVTFSGSARWSGILNLWKR